ncbi:MAG: hypothetical protein IK003_10475 [Prevotella sp.]|jgi:hypothetical protein|nr:hypothetical protein [Prevotella sp.]
MKKRLNRYTLILLTAVLAGCHQELTDYHTVARVTLGLPDTINVIRIQGTMTLQSLNTTTTTSTADMNGHTFETTVLRGAYKVDVNGMVRYTGQDGATRTRHYRAHTDYTPFADKPLSEAVLPITLLEE